jgi:hypothetical protein
MPLVRSSFPPVRRGRGPPGPLQEVATAIYYAAIASALVHHDVRITKLSHESLI